MKDKRRARVAPHLKAPQQEMTTAAVVRQMHDAGESLAEIRAATGASRQAIYAALRADDERGRPIVRCEQCVCAICGGTWQARRGRSKAKAKTRAGR
jgi:lambda repressor-like predicted transcriptional regulator